MLKGGVPDNRVKVLAAEFHKNDPRFVRRNMHSVLRYYDRHGTLIPRLCRSGLRTWVVFGENDDTKLQDAERHELQSCPRIDLVTIPGTGHFALNTHPGRIAELIWRRSPPPRIPPLLHPSLDRYRSSSEAGVEPQCSPQAARSLSLARKCQLALDSAPAARWPPIQQQHTETNARYGHPEQAATCTRGCTV
jgi:hypothetical protein